MAANRAEPAVAGEHRGVGAFVTCAVLLAGGLLLASAAHMDRAWFEIHMTWRRCAVDPADVRNFAIERGVVAALGATILACAFPLGRRARLHSAGALAANAARYGLPVLLSLVVCEIALRARSPKPKPHDDMPEKIDDDAKLKWRLLPSHTSPVPWRPSVAYHVNADGNRARSIDDLPDHAKPTLFFAGDSVTFGIGLDWDDTYPVLVGKRLGAQVVNLGVHAYAPDQSYLRTMEVLPTFEHPLAVVLLLMPEHLQRAATIGRKRLTLRDGVLAFVDASPQAWVDSPLRNLFVNVSHYHSADSIDDTRAVLAEMAARVRERGAAPLFVMTNYGAPCLPNEAGVPVFEKPLFGGLDVPWIRVDLDPSWHLADTHPDERADVKLADAITRALAEAQVLGTR